MKAKYIKSTSVCFKGEERMRYCPRCLEEYEDFEKFCPDCGAGLACRSVPPGAENNRNELVTIAVFENEPEAALSRSSLAAEGIWSYITNNIRKTCSPSPACFAEYVLQVSAANSPESCRILLRLWGGSPSHKIGLRQRTGV